MDKITDSLYELDPVFEEIKILYKDGIKLIDNDHIIHGFEKLYIAAENCIKILANKYLEKDGKILGEVEKEKKWNMPLLDEAARLINNKRLDNELEFSWMGVSILEYKGLSFFADKEYITYLEKDFENILKITQNEMGKNDKNGMRI